MRFKMAEKYHQQATGKNAGKWVPCTAKKQCRLGGDHIDQQAALFINQILKSRANEIDEDTIDLDTLKEELAILDARTKELYPDVPEGVTIHTHSELRFDYKALSDEAKEKAYEHWLENTDFSYEYEVIRDVVKEDETDILFEVEEVYVDDDGNVKYDGIMRFTPEEAVNIVKELDDEEVEDLQAFAGFESREDIYEYVRWNGINVNYPSKYKDGVYTTANSLEYFYITETPTFKNKLKAQADRYKKRAVKELGWYKSQQYFSELAEANEWDFNENGGY
jgi:hypothetical protein